MHGCLAPAEYRERLRIAHSVNRVGNASARRKRCSRARWARRLNELMPTARGINTKSLGYGGRNRGA